MQAIPGSHCSLLSCCCSTRSVKNVLLFADKVKKSRISKSFSCRADISVRAHGHDFDSSEKIARIPRRNGRRLLLSVMSGAALAPCLERNSAALAAEEGTSEPVAAGPIVPQLTAPEILAVSELTTSGEAPASEAPAEGNALIRKLLARSKANKEKNDKARLDDYYKRNYKEYFEYIEGTIRNKKTEELTEAERGIIEWLKKNR